MTANTTEWMGLNAIKLIEHIELDKGLDMVDKTGIGGKNE